MQVRKFIFHGSVFVFLPILHQERAEPVGASPPGIVFFWIFRMYEQGSKRGDFCAESWKSSKKNGISNGIRTRVAGMKTRCPRPLDDGDAFLVAFYNISLLYCLCKWKKRFFTGLWQKCAWKSRKSKGEVEKRPEFHLLLNRQSKQQEVSNADQFFNIHRKSVNFNKQM